MAKMIDRPAAKKDYEEALEALGPDWLHSVVVTKGKIYARCDRCGAIVRINKPILGSLHPCGGDRDE